MFPRCGGWRPKWPITPLATQRTSSAILEDAIHQMLNLREQRWLHSAALRLIGERTGFDALVEVGTELKEIGKAWSTIRTWCLRAIEIGLERGVARIAEKIESVADAEETAARRRSHALASSRWPEVPIDTRIAPSNVA